MSNEQLPHWQRHADTPKCNGAGIVMKLAATKVPFGKPVIARGAYAVSPTFMHHCANQPLTWLLMFVARCDQPSGTVRVMMPGHNLPAPHGDPPEADPDILIEGVFNVDVAKTSGICDEPGRYWVMFSLGDFVSPRIEFELN